MGVVGLVATTVPRGESKILSSEKFVSVGDASVYSWTSCGFRIGVTGAFLAWQRESWSSVPGSGSGSAMWIWSSQCVTELLLVNRWSMVVWVGVEVLRFAAPNGDPA